MTKRWFFSLIVILFISFSCLAASVGERRGETAPKNVENNMRQLVDYLTRGIPDKVEQAKSIAVWIATHVAYDHDTYDGEEKRRHKVGKRANEKDQSADSVFKDRIAVCAGFADLYGKMLSLAGIKSEKVSGYVMDNADSRSQAKTKVRRKEIGHVWTKVYVPGRKPLLVDVTWMARGRFGGGGRRQSETGRQRELRQNRRENKTYSHEMNYFDFSYEDLAQKGEYRFDKQRKIIKK